MIGTTKGFSGQPTSGIAFVHFADGSTAFIESGFGMRQLIACFGSLQAAIGHEIDYEIDSLGMMTEFSPTEGNR